MDFISSVQRILRLMTVVGLYPIIIRGSPFNRRFIHSQFLIIFFLTFNLALYTYSSNFHLFEKLNYNKVKDICSEFDVHFLYFFVFVNCLFKRKMFFNLLNRFNSLSELEKLNQENYKKLQRIETILIIFIIFSILYSISCYFTPWKILCYSPSQIYFYLLSCINETFILLLITLIRFHLKEINQEIEKINEFKINIFANTIFIDSNMKTENKLNPSERIRKLTKKQMKLSILSFEISNTFSILLLASISIKYVSFVCNLYPIVEFVLFEIHEMDIVNFIFRFIYVIAEILIIVFTCALTTNEVSYNTF